MATVYIEYDEGEFYLLVPEGERHMSGREVEVPPEFVIEYHEAKDAWKTMQGKLEAFYGSVRCHCERNVPGNPGAILRCTLPVRHEGNHRNGNCEWKRV